MPIYFVAARPNSSVIDGSGDHTIPVAVTVWGSSGLILSGQTGQSTANVAVVTSSDNQVTVNQKVADSIVNYISAISTHTVSKSDITLLN